MSPIKSALLGSLLLGLLANLVWAAGVLTPVASQSVNVATDQAAIASWGQGATGSPVPSGATYTGVRTSAGLTGLIACDNYAKYDASTTGSTQMIALSGSTTIYICGYSLVVGSTATNVKLVYGTGTNCATSPVDITPAWQFLANSGKVVAPGLWSGLKTAATGQAVCINASAANAVQAEVWYTQF